MYSWAANACVGEREGISIWNIVKQNHPYDTSSNFPGQAKESIARIEMYGEL